MVLAGTRQDKLWDLNLLDEAEDGTRVFFIDPNQVQEVRTP